MSVIGIDLGTTSSSVSIFRNGSVDLLEIEETNRAMPSCVAFAGKERLVGKRALAQLVDNPKKTICGVKAMIGLTYDEAKGLRNWGFDLKDVSSKPKILVQCGKDQKGFYPEEITSMILSRIWENTKKNLHTNPKGAVITVPASFNHAQRKATMDAAKIAGVPVLELINEPTAAALAYQYQNKTKTPTKMLILHFGGGSFNASVMIFDKGYLKVRASIGSSQLGGMNFDDQLFKYVTEHVLGDKIGGAVRNSVSACKLRLACETAKKNLSAAAHGRVEVKALRDGKDFHESIDREQFRKINKNIFEAIQKSVEGVLNEAGVEAGQISDVLTIGSSTRLPFIEEILTKDIGFDQRKIRKTIKPDEAAVFGAALRAAVLNDQNINLRTILDILPNAICRQGKKRGQFVDAFVRGDNFPKQIELKLSKKDDCSSLRFYSHGLTIVDNTFAWRKEHRFITEISVSGDECKSGKFTANVNSSGLFKITFSSKSGSLTPQENCGLSTDKIEKIIKDRELYRKEEEGIIRIKKDLYELETEVYKTQDKYGCDLSHFVEWIKNTSDPSFRDIRAKREELENVKLEKQKQHRGSGRPEKDLKLPFESTLSNENLLTKARELFQELGISYLTSERQNVPKHKPEKDLASKKRAGSEQKQDSNDNFEPLIFFNRAHKETHKLQGENAALWRKHKQMLEIITEKPLVFITSEKREDTIMIPTKENKLVVELLHLFKELGIITDIQRLPDGEIQDTGTRRKSADYEKAEKLDKRFGEKLYILSEKAKTEIKRLRMENNKLETLHKEMAEKLQNHCQTSVIAERDEYAPTVSKAPEETSEKMQDKNEVTESYKF